MTKKRMFSMDIVDSDAFLDLTPSAQALYFHLGMRADDDGFVGNAKKVTRMIGAKTSDLQLLIRKRFLLEFSDGIVCIKHWYINNTIKTDRYVPTTYSEERKRLEIKENKAYTERKRNTSGTQTETEWNQDGTQTEPQCFRRKEEDSRDLGESNNTHRECTCTRVDECLELVKEVSPVLFERHRLKPNSDFNLGMLLRDANYTLDEIKALCEKANKTYIVQPKYKTLDLLWVLNNKAKVEAAEIIEATPSTGGGNGEGRESIVSQMSRIYNKLKEEEENAS